MTTIETLLRKYIIQKGDKTKVITHTRIGDEKNNIFGGTYHIPDDKYESFMKIYYNEVIVKNKDEYLVERQLPENGCIVMDLDFQFDKTVKKRVITVNHITEFVNTVVTELKSIYQINDEDDKFHVFVLQRPNVNALDTKTKDGIHIIIGLKTENIFIQEYLRTKLISLAEEGQIFNNLPNTNNFNDVFDKCVANGNNGVSMVGSKKPNNEAYQLSYAFEVNETDIKQIDISTYLFANQFMQLSLRYKNHPILFYKNSFIDLREKKMKESEVKPVTESKVILINQKNDKINIDEITEHGNNIALSYLEEYKDWTRIIWSLKSHSLMLYDYAKELSKRSKKHSNMDVDESFDKSFDKFWDAYDCNNSKLSIASFYHYSKISDKKRFIEIRVKYSPKSIDDCVKNQTTETIIRCFYDLFGDDFIFTNGLIYYFNGINWEVSKTAVRRKFTNEFRNVFIDYQISVLNKLRLCDADSDEGKALTGKKDAITKLLKLIESNKIIKDCCNDSIIPYIEKKDVEFETNPYMFCFNNAVYDLKLMKWVDVSNRDDYMTLTTGYDYREPTQDETEELNDKFEKVFPNQEERKLYLTLLSTGLFGKTVEKFILATGSGRNGKGYTNELLLKTLGNYGYTCGNAVLLSQIKDGANQAIANMNHRRFVIYREPDTSLYTKLNSSTIKEITGGSEINARGLYSSDTKTNLKGTNCLECNKKPDMSGEIDNAIVMRLILIEFKSTFTKEVGDVDEANHIYLGDDNVKDKSYQEQHKFALFHILLEHWKEYIENDMNIERFVPSFVKDRVRDYLTNSDTKLSWFLSKYEKVDDDTEVIKIKDVLNDYKNSSEFYNMNKVEKRNCNEKNFIEFFEKNPFTRKYYKDREQRKIILNKYNLTNIRNILVGFKKIVEETENEVKGEY